MIFTCQFSCKCMRKPIWRKQQLLCPLECLRFKENRQCLLEKLFPNPQGEALQDVMPVLVQEKREKGAVPNTQQPSYKPVLTGMIASEQLKDSVVISAGGTVDETLFSPCELPGTSCSSNALMDIPTTGERVFVFRIPPEPQGNMAIASRKRKRNFLNLKKCSVSPTDQLWLGHNAVSNVFFKNALSYQSFTFYGNFPQSLTNAQIFFKVDIVLTNIMK